MQPAFYLFSSNFDGMLVKSLAKLIIFALTFLNK